MVAVLVAALLFSSWLGAPRTSEVAAFCVEQSKLPGDLVVVGSSTYTCPHPSPTPTVVYKVLLESSLSICDTPDTFGSVTNDKWLEMNVMGPASSWRFDGGKWVYTFVPYEEEVGFSGSVLREYRDGFTYPGFGVYKLYLYGGGSQVVSDYGSGYYYVHFTKLELTCK